MSKINSAIRARKLHKKCKREIHGLLAYMQQRVKKLNEHQDQERKNWSMLLFDFDSWLFFANQTNEIIDSDYINLVMNADTFSRKLTSKNTVAFVIDCIVTYSEKEYTSRKYKTAVFELFKQLNPNS